MEALIHALLERFVEELSYDNPELEFLLADTDMEHTRDRIVNEMITIMDDYVDEVTQ